MAYVGKTGAAKAKVILDTAGVGEAIQRGEFPPTRTSHGWFFDNGAFKDHKNGNAFAEDVWRRNVETIRDEGPTPDFLVLPDKVADAGSLEFSRSFIPTCRGVAPLALVVQDGMTTDEVAAVVAANSEIAYLFVGGSLEWKFETGEAWCNLAHSLGIKCHIGRIGTAPRVLWARRIGADSIDSCTPLWSYPNMRNFIRALTAPLQLSSLPGGHPPPPRKAWGNK